jgi:hypothetical protein
VICGPTQGQVALDVSASVFPVKYINVKISKCKGAFRETLRIVFHFSTSGHGYSAFIIHHGQCRDINDNLQTNKHNGAIDEASSSMKLISFFKQSFEGKNEITWWPRNKYWHTARINTTCSSVLMTGQRK